MRDSERNEDMHWLRALSESGRTLYQRADGDAVYADRSAVSFTVDALEGSSLLERGSAQAIVTSPPYYGLRSYLPEGSAASNREVGLRGGVEEYVEHLTDILCLLWEPLADDGTLWLVLGDTYGRAGRSSSERDGELLGVPWRLAFALSERGWLLRSAPPWVRTHGPPESVKNRPSVFHEQILMLTKGRGGGYFYDHEAVRLPTSLSEADRKKLREGKNRIGGKHKSAGGADPRGSAGDSEESEREVKASELTEGGRKLRASAGTNMGRKRAVGDLEWRALRTTDFHREALEAELSSLKRREADIEAALDGGGMLQERQSEEGQDINPVTPEAVYSSLEPYSGGHFAAYPRRLARRLITASTPENTEEGSPSVVLDPFIGSGTTALAARDLGRCCIGFDLDPDHLQLLAQRLKQQTLF